MESLQRRLPSIAASLVPALIEGEAGSGKEALALEFMKMRDTYTEEERKKIQEELMQHISKESVTCKECHRPQGYLPLSTIGYSQARIEELTQLEVIKLIDEYTKFYLPTMFDPDAAGRKKEPHADN